MSARRPGVAVAITLAELLARMRADRERWAWLIEAAGIRIAR